MLPESILNEIEGFAYCYLEKHEIAAITGAILECLSDPEHEVGKAFLKGRYRRKAEFNQNLIKLSNQLSSPAMAIEQKIAEQAWLNDLKVTR